MEKEKIKVKVNLEEYNDERIGIDDLLYVIDVAKHNGATHVHFYSDYDSGNIEVQFYYERMETDDELTARIKQKAYMDDFFLQREKQEYERLKQKFGA